MQNSKFWNPKKNYFALLLPPKAHNSNEGIMGYSSLFFCLFCQFFPMGQIFSFHLLPPSSKDVNYRVTPKSTQLSSNRVLEFFWKFEFYSLSRIQRGINLKIRLLLLFTTAVYCCLLLLPAKIINWMETA
jgi:hypothetical protein